MVLSTAAHRSLPGPQTFQAQLSIQWKPSRKYLQRCRRTWASNHRDELLALPTQEYSLHFKAVACHFLAGRAEENGCTATALSSSAHQRTLGLYKSKHLAQRFCDAPMKLSAARSL